MLNAIRCGGQLSFARAGNLRSLQAGGLIAEGSLGGLFYMRIGSSGLFEILTMVASERLPGCQDLRACMSPQVRHMAVTAP